MTEQYRKVGDSHREGPWAQGVAEMDARAAELERAGLLPSRFPDAPSVQTPIQPPVARIETFTPEALQAEFERLAKIYQEFGFNEHRALRMSAERFKDHIMGLRFSQPEAWVGRFDIPVVGFGQIPLEDQTRMVGIENWTSGLSLKDWEKDPRGYRTPKGTYSAWMQDGTVNLNRKPTIVRDTLAQDERGGTAQDGIGLYVAHPEVLNITT